ncbi:MAG: nucleoside hydrolase, partial [Anaerolineales bacterium]|nr:nucleoside hydrolase [Anaerolineales bacterium]
MTSVIIDCDPGHDDALAILLAAKHLDVLGITTVSGNESIDNVTNNALKLVEVGNLTHIPVVRGAEGPLLREAVYAPQVHGKSGMDGAEIPEPTTKLQEGHAVDFIIDTVMSTSDVVLLPMGPLTNIALALRKEPRLRDRVKLMSIMGGSSTNGNITPTAEFNIYVDAEAADIVYQSQIPMLMSGLNLTRQVLAKQEHIDEIRAINNPTTSVVADLLTFYLATSTRHSHDGAAMHDPCAVAAIIDPTLIEFKPMHVAVETAGTHTYG